MIDIRLNLLSSKLFTKILSSRSKWVLLTRQVETWNVPSDKKQKLNSKRVLNNLKITEPLGIMADNSLIYQEIR